MCGGPRDGALLRLSLANALLGAADPSAAIVEIEHALGYDPHYSAAWKLLGTARAAVDDAPGAIVAFERGIDAAARRGDIQSAREMSVLLRRLQRR